MEPETLSQADRLALNASEGWLILGNPEEARNELYSMSRIARLDTDVLLAKWKIHFLTREWSSALKVARTLCKVSPPRPEGWVCKAYCYYQQQDLRGARKILLQVVDRFPTEPVIFYNLACYTCQLGEISEAFEWFLEALRIENKRSLVLEALEDPDLTPLREQLRGLLPSRRARPASGRNPKKGHAEKG